MKHWLYRAGNKHASDVEAKRLANLRLARCRPAAIRFEEKTIWEPNTGCLLWFGVADKRGYGRFWLDSQKIKAHRASWIMSRGPLSPGGNVLHRCDTPACVNPDHLFVGSISDNAQDMLAKGRGVFQKHPEKHARGSRNGTAKLNEGQVKAIIIALNKGASQSAIARSLGLNPSTISHIANGRNWRHMRAGNEKDQ